MKKKILGITAVIVILLVAVIVVFPFTKTYWQISETPAILLSGEQKLSAYIPRIGLSEDEKQSLTDKLTDVADDFYKENGFVNYESVSPKCELVETGYKKAVYDLIDEASGAFWRVTVWNENGQYNHEVNKTKELEFKREELLFVNKALDTDKISMTVKFGEKIQKENPDWRAEATTKDEHIIRSVLSAVETAQLKPVESADSVDSWLAEVLVQGENGECSVKIGEKNVQINDKIYSIADGAVYRGAAFVFPELQK